VEWLVGGFEQLVAFVIEKLLTVTLTVKPWFATVLFAEPVEQFLLFLDRLFFK
jgi:hypothetical protein